MDLVCYLVDDRQLDIRPARNRREWMNQTPGSYAYRCLPLSIANAHGWEVRCPVICEAEWNGGPDKDDLHVVLTDEEKGSKGAENVPAFAESHFGSGILTFNVGGVIRTPPGHDLWVTGPVNEFKDGIQALSAVIETYWMPFTFTMNWKFTRPHVNVRFEKGEPFCFFFPIEHGLLERVDPVFDRIQQDPVLEKQYKSAFYLRALLAVHRKLKGKEFRITERERFEGWYIRGQTPVGDEIADHRKRLQPKPFRMRGASPRRPG
jgi:Family of unknown function (DUF6065)